jgi:hypothetical protein
MEQKLKLQPASFLLSVAKNNKHLKIQSDAAGRSGTRN